MKIKMIPLIALGLGALVAFRPSASVPMPEGGTLGAVELDGFTQSGAEEYGDLAGRAVLIEYFAYW